MCWNYLCTTLIKVFKVFWQHYEFIKSFVLSRSDECVLRATTFFQCVSLIISNALKKRLIAINNKEKWKWKRCQKKGKRKISDLVCGQYTNACKLGANWHEHDFLNLKTWSHLLKK
jgi:hypothetical protein